MEAKDVLNKSTISRSSMSSKLSPPTSMIKYLLTIVGML